MDPKKLEFSRDVTHAVDNICKLIFNIKSTDEMNKTLGVTHEQLETTLQKMIVALPDEIFTQTPELLEEIKNLCAQEFIFFQVQEIGNLSYQENLQKFIKFFSTDMKDRIEAYHKRHANMKEEKNG